MVVTTRIQKNAVETWRHQNSRNDTELTCAVYGDFDVGTCENQSGDKQTHRDGFAKSARRRDPVCIWWSENCLPTPQRNKMSLGSSQDFLVDGGPIVHFQKPWIRFFEKARWVRLEHYPNHRIQKRFLHTATKLQGCKPCHDKCKALLHRDKTYMKQFLVI